MDTFNKIQMIFVPFWLKAALAALVVGSFAASVLIFYWGVALETREDWVAAAASLATVVFPTLVLFLLVSGSSFGERSIIEKTERLLTETLPKALRDTPETRGAFTLAKEGVAWRSAAVGPKAEVFIRHVRGRCYGDYKIRFKDNLDVSKEIMLRIEVNVRRINLIILIDEERLARFERNIDGVMDRSEILFTKFKHCAMAADAHNQGFVGATREGEAMAPLAYLFNTELLTLFIEGRRHVGMVATANVAYDLVWNAAERLFFAQDLTFMIRAFTRVGGELFMVEEPKTEGGI